MFELHKAHFRYTNPIQEVSRVPYPFQEEAMKALDRIKERNPEGFSTMLVLPTGAGKTYTAAHWILQNYISQGVKVLWIAHRSELLRQAAETFWNDATEETLKGGPSFTTYVVSGEFGRSCNIKDEDLVIASRQSVISGDNLKYYTDWAKGKDKVADRKLLLVLDEAHHASCNSCKKIIKKLKRFIPNLDVLGLTATPERTAKNEQGALKKIFTTGSGIAYSVDLSTLMKLGILADMNQEEVSTEIDMTSMFSVDDFKRMSRLDLTSLDEVTLKKLTENAGRNKLIVDTYVNNKDRYGKTIVFAIDVNNAIALNGIFKKAGIKSDYVVSGLVTGPNCATSVDRNSDVIKAFRNNEIDVIINVNILTEGTDIPDVQTIFLARPTTSRILMTQMVGRGLRRTSQGKTSVNIVSFIDEWRDKVSFVSPRFLLDGEDNESSIQKNIRKSIMMYINAGEIESAAAELYDNHPGIYKNVNNIYPYGVIECAYLTKDEEGYDAEYTSDVLVFDEAKEIYSLILNDLETDIDSEDENIDDAYIDNKASELYFRYADKMSGRYIGISSDDIRNLIKTYLESCEVPVIKETTDRVDLFELAAELVEVADEEVDEELKRIWESREDIRNWYSYYIYQGLMDVYRRRHMTTTLKEPEWILPKKEDMDMDTLRKHYPEYYEALREYVFDNAYNPETGEWEAKSEDGTIYSSKYKKAFEVDHIIPMSKGGKTVKENIQLLYWKDNRKKGNKVE